MWRQRLARRRRKGLLSRHLWLSGMKTDVTEHVPERAKELVKRIIVDLDPGNETCNGRCDGENSRNLFRFVFQRLVALGRLPLGPAAPSETGKPQRSAGAQSPTSSPPLCPFWQQSSPKPARSKRRVTVVDSLNPITHCGGRKIRETECCRAIGNLDLGFRQRASRRAM